MLDADKIYVFTIDFGTETDTLDREGEAVAQSDVRPNRSQVEAILPCFTGAIEQVPPVFSAIKIDGKRAYARARAGEVPEMRARAVTIHSLALAPEDAALPADDPLEAVTLVARVSKGTYIRALARDVAVALGAVGHVAMLRRTKAGPFGLEAAISLDKLSSIAMARELEQTLLPMTAGLDDIPALPVTPDQARLLRQGRKLGGIAAKPGLHLATDCSVPVALVEFSEGELRVLRGFNL
jgi:tRNA pseudouridine55 synthase